VKKRNLEIPMWFTFYLCVLAFLVLLVFSVGEVERHSPVIDLDRVKDNTSLLIVGQCLIHILNGLITTCVGVSQRATGLGGNHNKVAVLVLAKEGLDVLGGVVHIDRGDGELVVGRHLWVLVVL
jgi:hypothetical protein